VSSPQPHELLTSNLAVIDRAVAFACRRHRLTDSDREDFASIVKLKLVEDDCAILRAYEGRSSFSTFISIAVQRMALDYRIHLWGKWHPSAEAKRLGAVAVELEQLLRRDGRSLDDAVAILLPRFEGITAESLASLVARLPERPPRRREVELDDAAAVAVTSGNEVEEPLLAAERRRVSERVSAVMSALIENLPDDERLILQLRFEGGMTVAQIARALALDQKVTYRRIERRMRELKEALLRAGIATADVLDLIGRDEALLRFDLGKRDSCPSIHADERATAESEGSP